jgi:hypothetical protein
VSLADWSVADMLTLGYRTGLRMWLQVCRLLLVDSRLGWSCLS